MGEEDVPVKIVESVTIRGILIIVQLWKDDVLSPDRVMGLGDLL